MSIFPFINGDEGIAVDRADYPLYKEVAWDFTKDCAIFKDGRPVIVERNEAIQVWIYKAIKTNRYDFDIYSWDYGSEYENLIGKGFTAGLIETESARYMKEALLINPYITNVDKIDVQFDGDTLTVKGNVSTIYGSVYLDF